MSKKKSKTLKVPDEEKNRRISREKEVLRSRETDPRITNVCGGDGVQILPLHLIEDIDQYG